jgi:hypothetical protein
LSRNHSKYLFNLESNNYSIVIEDPFLVTDIELDNTFHQSADLNKTAMRAIAKLIADISKYCKGESEIVLIGLGKGGILLPGVASGLRANEVSIVGYLFINSPIPGAIDPADSNFNFFESLPLISDWPDAPVIYFWNSDNYSENAQEATLRGWQVINEVSPQSIKDAANSLFF